jgi:hypothetical protein
MWEDFGPVGCYTPTEEERVILVRHLRPYIAFEPKTPQRDDEVARTQRELLPLDLHDWKRCEVRHWFDNNHHKALGRAPPEAKCAATTTYQREFDEPARMRLTARKTRSK